MGRIGSSWPRPTENWLITPLGVKAAQVHKERHERKNQKRRADRQINGRGLTKNESATVQPSHVPTTLNKKWTSRDRDWALYIVQATVKLKSATSLPSKLDSAGDEKKNKDYPSTSQKLKNLQLDGA